MTGTICVVPALRERDCNIQEHLRNHVHLTNCIHLKNHVHMQKPRRMSAESSLMRDLIVLQRSRSLRDPSTSPSWNSPVIGSLMKRLEKEGVTQRNDFGGVRSLGGELRKELRRGFGTSPISPGDGSRRNAGSIIVTEDSGKKEKGLGNSRNKGLVDPYAGSVLGSRIGENNNEVVGDESHRGSSKLGSLDNMRERRTTRREYNLSEGLEVDDSVPGNMLNMMKKTSRRKGVDDNSSVPGKRSGQSKKFIVDSHELPYPHFHHREDQGTKEEIESSYAAEHKGQAISVSHYHISGEESSRPRKRKFKGSKKSHAHGVSRELGHIYETSGLSIASNSLIHGAYKTKGFAGLQETELQTGGNELEVTQAPRNGCGIPWNWSRIHQRGKTILDFAGRSLSCGLSDSAARKMEGLAPQGHFGSHRDFPVVSGTSDHSNSSFDSDSEALPLLIEPGASQESAEGKVSGELSLYADHNFGFKQDHDSASDTRSTDQFGVGRGLEGSETLSHEFGHRSLTQKYAPKAFKELVGQNLVAQALNNAMLRGKIGLVYIFYGPHGTGKTSCARIFTAALNCNSLDQPRPCGVCSSCLAQSTQKSMNVKEVGSVGILDHENITSLLGSWVFSSSISHYRVLIVDDSDTLKSEAWNVISKILDQAPRHVVVILITTNLDQLPHTIVSRSQKFYFPKLKDVDIIKKLQAIALHEDLEIDKDALKLIASRSDGSLRDAEMMLDQLSLLGQRISLPLVQELVGLIPDDRLVDLLDLALSADTVNTVKSLRELMEAGVEPLALMSQLATLITDILAGSYKFSEEGHRKFFRRETLSKEEMERLRQALKTLSEAEKQLRLSSDRTTWLTAALLQLAPDQSYMLPSSSAGTSFRQRPIARNHTSEKQITDRESVDARRDHKDDMLENTHIKDFRSKKDIISAKSTKDPGPVSRGGSRAKASSSILSERNKSFEHNVDSKIIGKKAMPTTSFAYSMEVNEAGLRQFICRSPTKLEDIWERVLEKIHTNSLKQFLRVQGKLFSVSFGAAPTASLVFNHQEHKAIAEKSRASIIQAFQLALGCPVEIQIDYAPTQERKADLQARLSFPEGQSNASYAVQTHGLNSSTHRLQLGAPETQNNLRSEIGNDMITDGREKIQSHTLEASKSEIVEIEGDLASHQGHVGSQHIGKPVDEKRMESAWLQEAQSSPHLSTFGPYRPEKHKNARERPRTQNLTKSKVSLGYVIQQGEGNVEGFNRDQHHDYTGRWPKHKGISIAEKLEQENLRLESRSGGLLCWKTARVNHKKGTHYRIQTRKSRILTRLVPCAKCPCVKLNR
ncbi:protein STICHEL-like 3 isoform X1 [Cryptomeria japonica]|uniref:protein STICHEL-like 3 isoform X1 n=1 Tax=Cryptomeria japonica TaxID=3369 RepID=UPI0025AC6032|nr:protein STICHEL-like 3 isoform X1 [Cryptomeria japonica]XP_057822361.1 protein STICHEL-like 3 isoform X1 [Cryptomeria japonica]XP_057822362.1 protein STICHEL-like 3 isoform X1 [Cryptomeria japonica]XP_057822363.1 protein STICHEL-like 3 isoform X1 [Cryptomeria japonica]XP_057822364.1 protein STICHEL-like 3 isoform X1 [Cryptomeria japonica]XP_057822367.1 protein STICHEL-like 3 isoform X1 [Cryptomeria japonica]XP_057822368.1 protein STICHEL-like 3 isoform X1 [Cryptomeria japonica]XP_05782236